MHGLSSSNCYLAVIVITQVTFKHFESVKIPVYHLNETNQHIKEEDEKEKRDYHPRAQYSAHEKQLDEIYYHRSKTKPQTHTKHKSSVLSKTNFEDNNTKEVEDNNTNLVRKSGLEDNNTNLVRSSVFFRLWKVEDNKESESLLRLRHQPRKIKIKHMKNVFFLVFSPANRLTSGVFLGFQTMSTTENHRNKLRRKTLRHISISL